MNFNKKYGLWAIVVGAAEGLGEAYSIALAKRNLNLVMVDIELSAMNKLAQKLEKEYSIETKQLHLELAEKGAADKIMKATEKIDTGLIIYNAAFSLIKPFINHTPGELDKFIEVNTHTQIQLVYAFSKRLINQNRAGGIIMMSSLAGLLGMQLVSPYAATKAFTWNLAEAIHYELKPYGIDVMACIAGATSTPAYLKTNPEYGFFRPAVMKPEAVAESTLKKLGKKVLFIPGFSNRLNYFMLTKFMPRKMASKLANQTMRKMYSDKFEKTKFL